MASEFLVRLQQITPQLPDLKEFQQEQVGNVRMIEGEGGQIFSFGLLTTNSIKVMHAFMPQGVTLPDHDHESVWELVVVTQGAIQVELVDPWAGLVRKALGYGESFYASPHQRHSVQATEDSWLLVVQLPETPSQEGFEYAA